jgi:hypothetical protein
VDSFAERPFVVERRALAIGCPETGASKQPRVLLAGVQSVPGDYAPIALTALLGVEYWAAQPGIVDSWQDNCAHPRIHNLLESLLVGAKRTQTLSNADAANAEAQEGTLYWRWAALGYFPHDAFQLQLRPTCRPSLLIVPPNL